ncbi:T9SS type A sorting domain-containing protein [Marivirga sp.]|uniref:T9SS type A sorting domain-containing protein n=1 Tax=Marivirga sp. TaxID=2018662 RepID=UPI002D7E917B|nr:T9SS type A sorting domain-containing protein [Marivirga sp.]HET8859380.1 T9SS type A sorting domain-containing protein [Marivirga sp.]
MKRSIIFLLPFLLLGCHFLMAQQQVRYNYGNVAAKIESGNSSMQVSATTYSTQNLQTGAFKAQQGFLSVLARANSADSLALVDLYLATNPGDTTWINNGGWLTSPLNEWQGVGLNAEGRVTYLDVNNNNLTGTLPESLKTLDSLEFFFTYINPNLEGNLFDFLTNYSNLRSVVAHDCSFTGIILPAVFHANLQEVRIFNNQIEGEIPAEISNAIRLGELNIASNLLSGQLPASLTDLANVTSIDLSSNNFTGNIPANLPNLVSLEHLNLGNNSLTGEIPANIGDLQNILSISLNNNQLSGTVPATMENLTTLQVLSLYQNNLEGTLPDLIHLPSLVGLDVWGNGKLLVEIPDDIGTLTNLNTFAIGATVPNRGEFPAGLYQLTNLVRLDLGGQQFTGSLTEEVGNWTQLDNLYLWQNRLTGDLPAAFTNIASLRVLDVALNQITSIPDFSASSIRELYVSGNQLSFNSLIPNLTLPNFNFRNQARIGGDQDVELSIGQDYEIISAIEDQEGTQYTWIFNNDTIATNQTSLSINNFSLTNSGSYRVLATHPDIADFALSSGFSNLKIIGQPRSWYVDNRPNTARDFSSLYQAVYASKANDTIYVAGSPEPYQTAGSLLLNSPRVILGPGYFLNENAGLQFNTESAIVGDQLILAPGSDGSQVMGLSFSAPVRLNNSYFTEGDTLKNVSFIGNRFLAGSNFGFVSHIDSLTFKGNYDPIFAFYITDVQGEPSGLYANYQNFDISHNINIRVRPFNFQFSTSAVNNGMNNIVFSNNLIDTIANINDAVFVNNILKPHSSTGSTFTTNIDYTENLFQNTSGNLNVDNDFIPVDGTLAQGPYAGNSPYQLSGLPPIPSINNIIIGSRLSTKINVKSNNDNNILRLRYQFRRNNQSSSSFNVRGFNASPEVEVEFLPNRSSLQPNQLYDLVFQAVDDNGKRSHRTYIPYETIAANLSGNVIDVDNNNVNEGNIRLFAINPFANKYDTAAVQALAGTNTFNFENLILGDYIILADPDTSEYANLIPTYLGNTLDWQLADTLLLQGDQTSISITVEKKPEVSTTPGSEISGILEEEYEDADSTLRKLPRRRLSGAGVSVRRLAGSSKPANSTLRLLDEDYVVVAYVKTNENGEFSFPNLPLGDYRLRIEYPGVETNETSDIDFNLTGQQGEVVNVEALVKDGVINVKETGRVTASQPEESLVFSFYPNPVKNELYLNLENMLNANELIIFDIKGIIYKRLKVQNGQTKIDLYDLPTGSYVLRLQDADGNYLMSKMIKQ